MIRLERLKKRLAMYYNCEEAILIGAQSYTLDDGRNLTRANLNEIKRMINDLETQIACIENAAKSSRTKYVIPVDL